MAAAEQGTSRVQRVLATMALVLIGLSAIAVVLLLVLGAAGIPIRGGLVVLQLLPLPGLTLGLLLVIVLFVLLAMRRAREQGTQRGRR